MNVDLLLTLPVLIPLTASALCVAAWGAMRLQVAITVISSAALLVVSLILLMAVAHGAVLVTRYGDWAAPFAIAFAADRLAGAMVAVTGVLGLAVAVPAGGVISLRLQDNPLPNVDDPTPVFVDGWLLDATAIDANE